MFRRFWFWPRPARRSLPPARRAAPPPGRSEPASSSTRSRHQALSANGAERIIPIRFIEMLQSAGDTNNATEEGLLQSVQNANQTWKEAGVQFWVESIESYVMKDFYDMTPWADGPHAWSQVKSELVQTGTPFPNAPADAWKDTQTNTKKVWLQSVASVYAQQNEVTVWLKDTGDGGHYCQFPAEGRCCVWKGSALQANGDVHEPAHELGHYLGLAHSFDPPKYNDPSTQQPFKLSDRWDLVFKQGTSAANPNTYYDSKVAAEADEASLQLIDKDNGNCARANNGVVSCDVGDASYSEHLTEGDYGMKGTAFPHVDGHGDNVMSYLVPRVPPRDISDSQIAIVRKFLRWDEPFRSDHQNEIYAGFNYGTPVTSGERPRLGSWRQRQPAAKLDFDGDGLRDIGVWIPPTTGGGALGEFIVLLSSHGYSQSAGQYMDVHLGELGDTPVPANYTVGDNRTDLAVYHPYTGYWKWCPTASSAETTTCGTPAQAQFGARVDVPLPGLDYDGGPPDALTVFRPQTGAYYFKELSWSSNKAAFMSAPYSGAVPLPGQYDCDNLSDLAVYEPTTAQFKLVRSMQNWDVSQMTTRQFSSTFIPDPYDEGGVIPIAGQRYERYCWNGYFFLIKPRLSAVLFLPENGTWYMNMDPVGSSTVNACTWGSGGVMPIGGLDWNADGQSDMLYYDANSYSGGGEFDFKATTWSDCSGNELYSAWGGIRRPRQQVFSVSDMDGDGINDLMIVDPDQGTVTWIKSSSGYDYYDSRTFGSSYMEVL